MTEQNLKLRTARTLKWNAVDRFSSQLLYAVTGVLLANVVSKTDFGLVGVILMFQAFAVLFVDSGFGTALLQKKDTSNDDYSTVFWFNTGVAVSIYAVLFFCATPIAHLFGDRMELVNMSRVMFLTFIFTALGIVQTNRLTKRMDMKQVAVANIVSQVLSGGLGIALALGGYGAWALVWQSVCQSALKSLWLWGAERWLPSLRFSFASLKSMISVGSGVFTSSFLNVASLNAYTFVIGTIYPMATLGVYTQADKWSKMGYASLSQIFNTTFLPLLARFQDDAHRFGNAIGKANRVCAYIACPATGVLIVAATPLFHLLFGTKWDAAIPLFQILTARGLLIVLIAQANCYLLALGKSGKFIGSEIVKDVLMVVAIFAALPFHSVEALVWGQLVASVLTYLNVLVITCRATGVAVIGFLKDMAPYALLTIAVMVAVYCFAILELHPLWQLLLTASVGALLYVAVLAAMRSVVQREAIGYLLGRFRRKQQA